MTMHDLGILALGYLLGSIPTAWIAGWLLKRIDIRRHGSGNVGATNVFRVLGTVPGIIVACVDIGKGWLAVDVAIRSVPTPEWIPISAGFMAILGHNWPCWLGFRGGRGVLTSAGVFLHLAWLPLAGALATFGILFWLTRIVSAGSLSAAGAFVVLQWLVRGPWQAPILLWTGTAIAGMIVIRHIPNIRRLVSGTEHAFVRGRPRNRGAR